MRFSKNAVVLFQGDSITDCGRDRGRQEEVNCGPALGLGYAHFAGAELLGRFAGKGLQVMNRGIGGNRIVDLAARVREDVINLKPDLLSVLIGVNDTWHKYAKHGDQGVTVEKFERVYREFLEEVRGELPGVRVVLGEPFVLPCGVVTGEWEAEMKRRRGVVRKLAGEILPRAVFVGFQGMFDAALKEAPAAYWAVDGVHPTPAGHCLMAREWMKRVVG
jgi:lysophospholipase L1-like esterase